MHHISLDQRMKEEIVTCFYVAVDEFRNQDAIENCWKVGEEYMRELGLWPRLLGGIRVDFEDQLCTSEVRLGLWNHRFTLRVQEERQEISLCMFKREGLYSAIVSRYIR